VYAAVTRQDPDGRPAGGWRPAERLSREEALRLFTTDAAYAAFNEGRQGMLKTGYWADFVVVDRDVMNCPPEQIPGTRVLRTVIGGQPVYAAE
jgi:predicted amidohydrolase YtcJ